MSLTSQLHELLACLLAEEKEAEVSNEHLVSCIDLTLLNEHEPAEAFSSIKEKAECHPIAAICVFPQFLSLFLSLTNRHRATVVNFPQGNSDFESCLTELEAALTLGADEIDFVLPYQDYLYGTKQHALEQCKRVSDYCKDHKLTLKIILETGAFSNLEVTYQLARELIDLGVDFLKTSTGKIAQGASYSTAFTLLSAIKDAAAPCGLKVSGGIKTAAQAIGYARLAQLVLNKPLDKSWFRIGASSLLDELTKK